MELIVFPIAFIYFLWLHHRDRKAQASPWRIEANATIERDEAGQIRTIYLHL